MKHPQIRRARKVGEAVFRGAGSVYTFEVFPLTTEIRDSAAVYIISRRIVDRFKTGHHRTICVGEANSIVSEIKKHKRAKCAKANEANAVCILRENDSKARSQVIDDLVAARSFSCIRNVSKPIARPARAKPAKRSVGSTATTENSLAGVPGIRKPKARVAESKTAGPKSPARTKKPASAPRKKRAAKITSSDLVAERAAPQRARVAVKEQASKSKSRIQSSADSSRRQRGLPKPEKPVSLRAKARAAGKSRSRTKLAA